MPVMHVKFGLRWRCLLASVCLCVVACHAQGGTPFHSPSAPLREEIDSAIGAVKPALVRIHVISAEYQDGRETKMQSVGSGAIITKDGYIITNHHVAGHAIRMFCTLSDREEVEAEWVGTDPLTDIAVVKLKTESGRSFTPARFGDSSSIHVGESVLAMGSPMALSQSVTLGIISNTEMVMPRFFGPMARFKLDGEDVGMLVRWIGHDAPIYGGNSGGPLVNLRGEIIGINEISFGLAGAIPGNLANSIASQIISHGKIQRAWLGADFRPQFKHQEERRGVLVSGVLPDSPAARAGLQAGDRLLQLGGAPTNVRYDEEMPDFMRLVTALPIGQEVAALLERDSKELTIKLNPIERGEFSLRPRELKAWGLTGCDLSVLMSKEMKRASPEGVLVTSVRPGGPAGESKPPIEARDVLVEVNGTKLRNVAQLQALTTELRKGKSEPVALIATFERKAGRYLAAVLVGVQEPKDPGLEVTKAWLPVETHVISREIARQVGKPELKGFYISRVYPQSTAENAGLKPGDFITSLDGENLAASSLEHDDELSTLIRQYDIGKTVELGILRDSGPLKVSVELIRSPRLKREMKKYNNNDFEFVVRDLSFFDRVEEEWSNDQPGVLVEEVKPGSWAELGALLVGDLLLEVDGQPVNTVESVRAAMESISAKKNKLVILKVLRGIHSLFLEIEPNWKA
jgi:serine protease Do